MRGGLCAAPPRAPLVRPGPSHCVDGPWGAPTCCASRFLGPIIILTMVVTEFYPQIRIPLLSIALPPALALSLGMLRARLHSLRTPLISTQALTFTPSLRARLHSFLALLLHGVPPSQARFQQAVQ